MEVDLNIECGSISSSVNSFDNTIKTSLTGIEEQELINEVLEKCDIDLILSNIDVDKINKFLDERMRW